MCNFYIWLKNKNQLKSSYLLKENYYHLILFQRPNIDHYVNECYKDLIAITFMPQNDMQYTASDKFAETKQEI